MSAICPSDSRQQKYTETTLSLNFSLPLDWGRSMSTVAYNYNQSKQSRSSTVSVTGSSGEYRDLTWSAYGGYEQYRQDGNGNTTTGAVTCRKIPASALCEQAMTRVKTIDRPDSVRPAPWSFTPEA
jgi:outer membrane usher protein FimD/PapC